MLPGTCTIKLCRFIITALFQYANTFLPKSYSKFFLLTQNRGVITDPLSLMVQTTGVGNILYWGENVVCNLSLLNELPNQKS